ncbi:hypothetical protein [Sphingomonas bacterium]|uniref:hypothetical protein n=1 Tax=Sphingomonas bacterium TaxID=1895847 RepID=UPI0015763306|nr:hypothetical protein [Sphingomonas bacterium]
MPTFARSFAVNALAEWDANSSPNNAVRTLFNRWSLPGEMSVGEAVLRLGLRDSYLNFYIKGQSVAKLSIGRNGPKLSVHKAYTSGRRKEREGNGAPPVQGYEDYDAKALAHPATGSLVAGWIETAESYASAEKRFVDDLITANPGVIDLEMGLPASDLPGSERVAPRMDLVVAQCVNGEPPSIAFWEAKCANNPELRASGDTAPRVVKQLGKYVRWMEESGRIAQVQQAYRNTATGLLVAYRVFRESGASDPECVAIWKALAELDAPTVIVQPGIVIGNYWPDGSPERIASSRMAQSAASFARKDHRLKLDRADIQVHEVGPDHDGPVLPLLPTTPVSG